MELIVPELESKNMLEEDNGRKVMWGEKHGNGIPLTIVKSDGGFTYDTSDIAAIKHRVEEERANWASIMLHTTSVTHTYSINKLPCNKISVINVRFTVDICDRCWSVFAFSNVRKLC